MGESIIQAIVMQMQYELDYRQMAHLKAVLSNEFQKLDIHEKKDNINIHQDNEKLLDAFVSAKKVEGCSDKTLAYYRSTIEHLFETIDIMACHIETSDIHTKQRKDSTLVEYNVILKKLSAKYKFKDIDVDDDLKCFVAAMGKDTNDYVVAVFCDSVPKKKHIATKFVYGAI